MRLHFFTDMASPRNAKDLKKMLTDTKEEMDDVHRTLEKLRGLSHDETTETAMLRSRIDEQSNLICILKQRADEMLLRCQALGRINTELEDLTAKGQKELDVEKKKSLMLERRFMELAANHQKMISFKDEYKTQNVKLKKENEQLCQENLNLFSAELELKEETVQKLNKEIKLLTEKYRNLENESHENARKLHAELTQTITHHQLSESSWRDQLNDTKRKLKDAMEMCIDLKGQIQNTEDTHLMKEKEMKDSIISLAKEKDKFLNLSVERGKVIQEKQVEVQQLDTRCKEAEQARTSAEERFEREAAAVNAKRKVYELQRALDDSLNTCSKLQKDYDAYKEHSTDLLTKEKQLNSRLRHVMG